MANADTITWRELLAETRSLVGDDAHARWICETATATTPAEFAAISEQPATERAVAHLDAMVVRARAGEPIQYVLGSWGFRHLDLALDHRVLIPRPETELVAEVAIQLAAAAGPIRSVADLGTGSGAIGLAMATELPRHGTTVWITDASPAALDVARSNLAGIGVGAVNVTVSEGSWTDALPGDVGFDVIVSNPPYVADASTEIERLVSDWEPRGALFAGTDGLDDIRILIRDAPGHLRPGGWLVLEHGHDQGGAVRTLMEERGLVEVETRRDLAGLDRMSLGRRSTHLFETAVDGGSDGEQTARVRHLTNSLSDYAHLLQWSTTPGVREWRAGRDRVVDLADVLSEYGPGGRLERNGTIPAIIEIDGDPVGSVQLDQLTDDAAATFGLDLVDGVWSLDVCVGRPERDERRVHRAVARAAADYLRDARDARDVIVLPSVGDTRAIASYRAAGFGAEQVVRALETHDGDGRDALRLHDRP